MKNRPTEFKGKDKGYAVIFILGSKLEFLETHKDLASMTTKWYANDAFKLHLK